MAILTDQLGRVLAGRYRLDQGLGTGASAHVFLATDLRLKRLVAVKLLHPGLAADSAFIRRFQQEAQLVASLNHPNLVRVFDWGEEKDGPFLVLEHLSGGSLRDLLDAGGRLSLAQAGLIGSQAARGLSYAHRRGLVHRDIKPANLLFDEEGRVRVGDFGLARALAEAAWTEPEGMILGTARYASPEQAQGHRVDDRSDVFALALVLYEAVTGSVPFSSDSTVSTLMARVDRPLPPDPELGALYPILAQATINESHVRLSAAELATELETLSHVLGPPEPLRLVPPTPVGLGDIEQTEIGAMANRIETEAPDAAAIEDLTIVDASGPTGPIGVVEQRESVPRRSYGRRKRVLTVAVGLLLFLVLLLGGAAAVLRYVVYDYKVPALSHMTKSAATALITKNGLVLDVKSHVFSSTIASGDVISQSPSPGHLVRKGTVVGVVLSQGHAPVAVPSVLGLTGAAATTKLVGAHLVAVVASRTYSATVPSGSVISQLPTGGKSPFESKVSLVVSEGPAPVSISNLSGETWQEAASSLTALGLKPTESLVNSSTVTSGQVISTAPSASSPPVAVGSSVSVVVSKGPQIVAVPNVIGSSVEQAVATLKSDGFVVSEVIGPPFPTTVVTTTPSAGTPEIIGTSVILYAS